MRYIAGVVDSEFDLPAKKHFNQGILDLSIQLQLAL